MAQNITYLLGAGASANALPTYNNFGVRFKHFTELFKEGSDLFNKSDAVKRATIIEMHSLMKYFLSEFEYHNTPDTIAKKYFHKQVNDSHLNVTNVKQLLTLFFLYEQTVDPKSISELYTHKDSNQIDIVTKHFLDKRYDSLIAGLLIPKKNELNLLSQFKILTWNYDLQFELTFRNYKGKNTDLGQVQNLLQSFPKIYNDVKNSFDINKFSLLHLNGLAYYNKGLQSDEFGTPMSYNSGLSEYLLDVYQKMNSHTEIHCTKYYTLLNFAWENLNEDYHIKNNEILNNAIRVAQETEYLVVIGYSFPIFNAAIDSELIKNMNRLKKVYIQSPDAELIKRILSKAYFSEKPQSFIEDVGFTNPFYIPTEWNFGDINTD